MTSALLTAVLVINELMASNLGTMMSPATNFDSWIEIYNPTGRDIDLSGMYLSNNSENLTMWQMPDDIGIVPAGGFKVVWLGSNNIKSNQAPFSLDCDGGFIYLSDTEGQQIDGVEYPKAMSRTSYARTIDGEGDWGWTAYPTPEATNATSAFASERLDPPTISLGSQLFTSSVDVQVDIPEGATLVYTTNGSVPTEVPAISTEIEDTWKDWIVNGDCEGDDYSCLIGKDAEDGELGNNFVDGEGVDGSRCVKIHAKRNPTNSWDAQFFVYTPNQTLLAGAKYHFHMKVRADKNAYISVQSHTTPGTYIHWQMLDNGYNITTQWQDIDYEGTVTAEQAGASGLQTIAFNLNESREENYYYFDDISWESDANNTSSGSSFISTDGQFTFNKTTNLCCRLFKDGYLPSVPVTRSYIQTTNEYTIPVISIVGDQRYFTDAMWGIDTKGNNGIAGNGQDTPCNWNMDWDRPVNFSYINTDGEMVFNQYVNISVSGGWTRSASPRSFKLKSSKEFDGMNHLDYMFFPQKPYIHNKAILLRNGGNDTWDNNQSRFMDPALQTIVQRSGIDLDLQSYLPVIEYVNGQFRGVLNLREVNNKKFVESNHGYDDDLLDMFENFEFNVGTSDVLERIYELGNHINDDGAYDELKQLLDIDEFTNYMATELFLGSNDWPHNNVKAYRSQDNGRYRFVFFDLDFAFKNSNPFSDIYDHQTNTGYSSTSYMGFCKFFINLLNHDEFRKKFIDTYCIIAGSVYEVNRATEIVDELADQVRPMAQLDGWRSPDTSANKIKDELTTRLQRMMDCMQQFKPMKLSSTTRHFAELSSDTEGATLYVNNIEVPYSYFDGVLFEPITLEAKAPAGYSFDSWRKAGSSTQTIFSYGDFWQYYDKGELQGINWRQTDYNEGSWSTGTAPLGYNMTGVKTTVSFGSNSSNKNPTTYFRYMLNLNSVPSPQDIYTLNYKVDDGCVVYVNGTEAGRVNMPSGNITYNTYSSTYAETEPLAGSINIPSTLLKSGKNVIAVEVHNTSATSSDLFWDAELTAIKATSDDAIYSRESIIDIPSDSKVSLVACFTPLSSDEIAEQGITPVRINEISASNETYVNEYWKKNDWVELYNTTDEPIDVEGMYLSDNVNKPKKYQISKADSQATTIIEPHGHLIIWCDKLDPLTQLHATFKLSNEGGDVLLTSADETWCDRLTYTGHEPDETIGRYPDGSAEVYVTNVPTIAKSNLISSYMTAVEQPFTTDIPDLADATGSDISIRASQGHLLISSTNTGSMTLNIVTVAGQSISSETIYLENGQYETSVGQLPAGIYVAYAIDGQGSKASCKFVIR